MAQRAAALYLHLNTKATLFITAFFFFLKKAAGGILDRKETRNRTDWTNKAQAQKQPLYIFRIFQTQKRPILRGWCGLNETPVSSLMVGSWLFSPQQTTLVPINPNKNPLRPELFDLHSNLTDRGLAGDVAWHAPVKGEGA